MYTDCWLVISQAEAYLFLHFPHMYVHCKTYVFNEIKWMTLLDFEILALNFS